MALTMPMHHTTMPMACQTQIRHPYDYHHLLKENTREIMSLGRATKSEKVLVFQRIQKKGMHQGLISNEPPYHNI